MLNLIISYNNFIRKYVFCDTPVYFFIYFTNRMHT